MGTLPPEDCRLAIGIFMWCSALPLTASRLAMSDFRSTMAGDRRVNDGVAEIGQSSCPDAVAGDEDEGRCNATMQRCKMK